MSTHKVPVVVIDEIIPHPNADRLEIARISGWECVVTKGRFHKGQMCVYVPVDSILPWELEQKIFPPGSKIKLNKSRIKSIKIRGYLSQGLLLTPEELNLQNYFEGQDLMEELGIKKYEPLISSIPVQLQPKTAKRHKNKNFHEYTDLQNFKWYNRMFQPGEMVVVTEKLHGTNFRAGWVKRDKINWFTRILIWLKLASEYQFCWGSRRVQIQGKLFYKGYYSEDVYTKMVKQYNLKKIIPKGYVIYGEIVGDKIQKNYTYGCGPGEHQLYVFDVMKDGKYIDFYEFDVFTAFYLEPNLTSVPVLYYGPWYKDLEVYYRDGDSYIGNQKVREGIVIKPTIETECSIGRKILKCISPAYYLKNAEEDGTDFH